MPFRLDIPGYDDSVAEFVESVLTGTIEEDPLLSEIPTWKHAYPRDKIGVDDSSSLHHAAFHVEQAVAFDLNAIRDGDIAHFTLTLRQAAEGYRDQVAAQVVTKMREMTEAGGQSIDAAGRPLSYDMLLDALEKYEFTFAEDGTPIMPQMVMNPATAELLSRLELTAAHVERLENMLRQKKAEHDAHKRERRLR
jgi:hypothetical protein